MVNCDIDKLKILATEFRLAIEKCKSIRTPAFSFENFPRGCCGQACHLLAKYLEQNGCGRFNYILGNRQGSSHAWLEQGKVIVDITADQFNDNNQPVIVTVEHNWHDQFCGEIDSVADFDKYNEQFRINAWHVYKKVLETLKKGN